MIFSAVLFKTCYFAINEKNLATSAINIVASAEARSFSIPNSQDTWGWLLKMAAQGGRAVLFSHRPILKRTIQAIYRYHLKPREQKTAANK